MDIQLEKGPVLEIRDAEIGDTSFPISQKNHARHRPAGPIFW